MFPILPPQQQTAIEYLLLGATITEAAGAVGVTRQTVSEWSNHHPPFQTELTRRRAEALRDVQQRLEEAANGCRPPVDLSLAVEAKRRA